MNQETAEQIVSLLESIDSKLDLLAGLKAKLDEIESSISDIKTEISGFTHEGQTYPGPIQEIASSLSAIETSVSNIDMNTTG